MASVNQMIEAAEVAGFVRAECAHNTPNHVVLDYPEALVGSRSGPFWRIHTDMSKTPHQTLISGTDTPDQRVSLKNAIDFAQRVAARHPKPVPAPRILRVQPASRIDNLTADGQEMTQQPYPLFVSEDGSVGRQDFWDGRILRVLGFQRDLAVQQLDLRWAYAWTEPEKAVGMYVVAVDKDGNMFNLDTAVESITVEGPERPGEDRA